MAVVTITLTDTDLETGAYAANFKIEDSRIEQGQFTGAHMVGVCIMNELRDPGFSSKVWDFARTVAASQGAAIANADSEGQTSAG